jgi:polyhydroxybutyrate depolymerase
MARIASLLLLSLFALAPASADDAGRYTLTHDGATRSYVVRLPGKSVARLPLVLVLHGGGGNAANAEQMTGFTAKGRRENFIVVYPEGSGRLRDKLLTWNARHCCAYAMKNEVDDVGFIDALLDELIANYPVDTSRIYVTGMSNGGMMTHRLGIELSNRFAAIAPVVATIFGDERPASVAVSALMINGALDENVPPAGGAPGGRGDRAWDGTPAKPALAQFQYWSDVNRCGRAAENDSRKWTHWRTACGKEAVELYLVKDNGHAWPGGEPGSARGDKPSEAMNATDVIWRFFQAHTKQATGG